MPFQKDKSFLVIYLKDGDRHEQHLNVWAHEPDLDDIQARERLFHMTGSKHQIQVLDIRRIG